MKRVAPSFCDLDDMGWSFFAVRSVRWYDCWDGWRESWCGVRVGQGRGGVLLRVCYADGDVTAR